MDAGGGPLSMSSFVLPLEIVAQMAVLQMYKKGSLIKEKSVSMIKAYREYRRSCDQGVVQQMDKQCTACNG
jgi:hypothetical protein